MGISLALVASVFASLSNYCMRRNLDAGGTTKAMLSVQLSAAFLIAFLLAPVRTQNFEAVFSTLFLGIITGLVFGMMMLFLGKALEKGPPGITIALLNASVVLPGLFMAMTFGVSFGYEYNFLHAAGSILVLGGIFWAGWGLQGIKSINSWLLFSLAAFFLHLLFLILMQWRALMINVDIRSHFLQIIDSKDAASEWFLPMIYFSAALLQTYFFVTSEKRIPSREEWSYGLFGGIGTSMCTFFLIWSTESASPLENAMIFPVFSVMIILFCNSWGRWLYDEKVNWKACNLCIGGIILGMVDWRTILSYFS